MKFKVEDMTCNHCRMHVEKALAEGGESSVKVDLDTKTVETGGDLTAEKVVELLDNAGYTALIQ